MEPDSIIYTKYKNKLFKYYKEDSIWFYDEIDLSYDPPQERWAGWVGAIYRNKTKDEFIELLKSEYSRETVINSEEWEWVKIK